MCVNDGSTDQTLAYLVQLHEQDERIQILDLTRNFGKGAALSAGLDYARGAAVIPLDADLQDPPDLIPQLLDKWREGFDVVNACRQSRVADSWAKRSSAWLFYWFINRVSEIDIPRDVGDFRLLSCAAVDALKQLPERRRFMKGIFAWIGFPTATIYYDRPARHAGRSQWNWRRLTSLAIEGITSFSRVPLQLVFYLGLCVSMTAFGYGCYLLIRTWVFGNPVAGYASLMVTILFLGGVQMLSLGLVGEYLSRVYIETKQRPVYLIRRTWQATPVSTSYH